MPNHCYNEIQFSGNEAMLSEFRERCLVKKDDEMVLSFEKIVPIPDDLPESTKEGLPNWYAWRLNNWGTKWEIMESEVLDDKPKIFKIYFITAWGPPEPIIKRIQEMFPYMAIIGEYWEEFDHFSGRY